MGFFKNFIKGQFIEVIEWTEENSNRMVYRFPVQDKEIKMGAQLTVRPSQIAVFVNEGQIADIFEPGRHTLETQNMPVLTKLKSWKYGFDSPFKAEVYFVSTKQFTNMKWGTQNPVMMRDPEFGRIRVRALGLYAFKVNDAATFLKEIFGTSGDFTTDGIASHLRSVIVGKLSDLFAESNIPVMDFTSQLDELAQIGRDKLQATFNHIGFELTQFVIENISMPEEVMKAMDERAKMSMLGVNDYSTYKTLDAVGKAAENPSGGMAGAGVGLGAGAALGNMMASNMEKKTVVCKHCQSSMNENSKFCPNCGKPSVEMATCISCSQPIPMHSKFCAHCGSKQEKVCSNCQEPVTGKFCQSCGTKVE